MLWLKREDLPESIDAKGTILPIFADFRTWVRVDSVIQDNAIPEGLKLPVICDLIGINPFAFKGDQKDLWDAIMAFIFATKRLKNLMPRQTDDKAIGSNTIWTLYMQRLDSNTI